MSLVSAGAKWFGGAAVSVASFTVRKAAEAFQQHPQPPSKLSLEPVAALARFIMFLGKCDSVKPDVCDNDVIYDEPYASVGGRDIVQGPLRSLRGTGINKLMDQHSFNYSVEELIRCYPPGTKESLILAPAIKAQVLVFLLLINTYEDRPTKDHFFPKIKLSENYGQQVYKHFFPASNDYDKYAVTKFSSTKGGWTISYPCKKYDNKNITNDEIKTQALSIVLQFREKLKEATVPGILKDDSKLEELDVRVMESFDFDDETATLIADIFVFLKSVARKTPDEDYSTAIDHKLKSRVKTYQKVISKHSNEPYDMNREVDSSSPRQMIEVPVDNTTSAFDDLINNDYSGGDMADKNNDDESF
ncbi:MAG: hypothetical protein H7A37_07160 [Chlamydiales bacterium]|nr:hypothetical protein [Chlamydiales bacterium]